MKTLPILKVLLCSAVLFSAQTFASDVTQQEFNTAYMAYQEAMKTDDSKLKFETAKRAYELGRAIYGDLDKDTIALAINYADEIAYDDRADKADLLKKVLNDIDALEGEDSERKIPVLISLAKIQLSKSKKSAKVLLRQAIDISKKSTRLGLAAQTYLDASEVLVGIPSELRTVSMYVDNAEEIANKTLDKNAWLNFYIAYRKADVLIAFNQREEAITVLESKLERLDSSMSFDSPLEMQMRIRLVQLYEETDQSDKATKQCIALGSLTPWKDDLEQVPLYRVLPDIKDIKSTRKTSIVASFDVTPEGNVENIEIGDVNGNKVFVKPLIAALKKWRYAPKFEDGKPVTASSKIRMDFQVQ